MNHWFGYNIYQVMNITDVDDKIIKKANESNTTITEVSRKYTKLFFEDMKNLNVDLPDTLT